ncbi:MAG: hypothetical protein M0R47_06885 [Methylobacter sp.]|jgi:hypothetical protein|uniref:hypothetical protein n=1 Tax=Methylobacter sp. TaxID=2051955 RepID=UPI0025E313A7|nr:hypothetical protein [Methylobacter sp.]MCK9620247.1 hypothetical protein [Methylobacter sp.]
MTQPETLTSTSAPPAYLSLKVGQAVKTGSRSQGYVHYRILTDTAQQQLYITLIGNDGDGCYSKEIVPFDKIEQCLHGIDTSKPIASKRFQPAFIGKSANNAGFLAAILRAECLLAPAPDAVHQHTVQPDWPAWKTALLTLALKAEPYQPEPPKPRIRSTTPVPDSSHDHKPFIVQHNPAESPIPSVRAELAAEILEGTPTAHAPSGAGLDAELDDAEMECLQRSALGADGTGQPDEEDVDLNSPAATVKLASKKPRPGQRAQARTAEKRS